MEDLIRSHGLDSQGIKLITAIDSISLGIDTAIYCGLMINELVSNSLKYAFPNGRSGEIRVIFHSVDGEIELIVSDNGVGIPESVNLRDLRTLGLQLVTMLAEDQLHGTVNVKRPEGTEFQIRFKNPQQQRNPWKCPRHYSSNPQISSWKTPEYALVLRFHVTRVTLPEYEN